MVINVRVVRWLAAVALLSASCMQGGVSPPPGTGAGGAQGGSNGGSGGSRATGGSGGRGGSGGTAAPTAGTGGSGGPVGPGPGPGPQDAGREAPRSMDASATIDMRPAPMGDAGGAAPINPPAQPPGPWARNVEISLVEVSQAVFIKLGEGAAGQPAAPVPVAMRNAPLIEGRSMFFRVHARTTAGFTPRQLRAVLTVEFDPSNRLDLEATRMVSGSSSLNDVNSTFNFLVPADKVKANGALAVSIYETTMPAGAEPSLQPKFAGELGVKGGRMEVFVVIVPVGITSDTPERRAKLAADFMDLYPIQKVNIRVGPPATLPGNFSSSAGFAILRDRRMQEMGKPYEYYHMIINTTGAGFSGVAGGGGPRLAITITRTPNLDGNTNTFAHEIGHNHGLSHMPGCGAAGPDQNYPYVPTKAPMGTTWPAGFMGVNGYSLSTNSFKSAAMFRELMSYCRPRWVSDYVYNRFETRARQLMAMVPNTAAMAKEMSTRSLQGWAGPGEKPNFGLALGQLVDESTTAITDDRYALLTLTDGRQIKVPVAVSTLTDDVTKEFALNLDTDQYSVDEVVQAEVVVGTERTVVDVSPMYLQSLRR